MSQRGYPPLDTPVCFQQKQQVVLWVIQRLVSYFKVGTLFFNGSKFVFWADQNRLLSSRWSIPYFLEIVIECLFGEFLRIVLCSMRYS